MDTYQVWLFCNLDLMYCRRKYLLKLLACSYDTKLTEVWNEHLQKKIKTTAFNELFASHLSVKGCVTGGCVTGGHRGGLVGVPSVRLPWYLQGTE